MSKVHGFNVLKIISATLIVFHHYQQVFDVVYSHVNFYSGHFNFGYLVELFFIISGFLTLYSDKVRGGTECKLFHKLLRFFPMAAVACAFTLILKSVRASNIEALWNVKTLFANFFLVFSGWPFFSMMGINNPTWYLCVLVQCYLVYYLVRFFARKLKINRIWFDASVIVLVFILYRYNLVEESSYRGIGAYSVGLILCNVKDRIPKRKGAASLLLVLSIALLIALPSHQRRILTYMTYPVLIMFCLWCDGKISEGKEKVLELLGKMSFEVYIWHYPVMALEQMFLRVSGFEVQRSYLSMAIFMLMVWLLAYPLYRYVEVPINIMVKEKLS